MTTGEYFMVRTQIQLTEQQSIKLKELAAGQNVSTAEIIRRAVDQFLSTSNHISNAEQRRLALEFVGKYPSGLTDLSENHDRYLAEAYGSVEPFDL
jgi:hypothetical protein